MESLYKLAAEFKE